MCDVAHIVLCLERLCRAGRPELSAASRSGSKSIRREEARE